MKTESLDEFRIIDQYLKPLAHSAASFGLEDDAAQFENLVYTKDMIVEGVHFFSDDPPHKIASKALGVNMSDLAAKGATPIGYLMGLGLSSGIGEAWLKGFHQGLKHDQDVYNIDLLGGDLVSSPCNFISISAFGRAPKGGMIKRSGAQPGDLVVVTGTIGDGWLGLQARRNKLGALSSSYQDYLIERYLCPSPRLNVGKALAGVATSCTDVSDGLLADARNIAQASGVQIVIDGMRVPLSAAARQWLDVSAEASPEQLWTGGDDFELIATIPSCINMVDFVSALDVPISVVGRVAFGSGVVVHDQDGGDVTPRIMGFSYGF